MLHVRSPGGEHGAPQTAIECVSSAVGWGCDALHRCVHDGRASHAMLREVRDSGLQDRSVKRTPVPLLGSFPHGILQ